MNKKLLDKKINSFLKVNGNGYGYGMGYGSGYGSGSGYDSGDGSGSGSGKGYGSGSGKCHPYYGGVASINGHRIYIVDCLPTIIYFTKNNIAKGAIVNDYLTIAPCYIAKIENCFAHGETVKEAICDAQGKAFGIMPIEARIKSFLEKFEVGKKYPAKDLYDWHYLLTGSCKFGRDMFIKEKNINIESDKFTINEFIALTKEAYKKNIIKKLEEALKGMK